ncbi:MAG: peroxidase family protein [Phycisphaerales bacterium JB052]
MYTMRRLIFVCGTAISCGAASAAEPITRPADDKDTVRRSTVHRQLVPHIDHDEADAQRGNNAAEFPHEFRSIDGSGNNPLHMDWGAAGTEFQRLMASDYPIADGSIPARANGPSARAVSNAVCASPGDLPNDRGASDYLWQWGQFLDHDLTETPITDDTLDITVPTGDEWFDPFNTGTQVIGMHRSAYSIDDAGERHQFNNITAYIDASNVYGSEDERAHELRTNDGTGMLKTSEGDLLPYNINGFDNAPSADDPTMFLGGDIRANEQAGLTAMHTLFVREHNYWAQQMADQFPDADGDELFERARAIVAAEMQVITYHEFLPLLLGESWIGDYTGYNPDVPPKISNEFATAAYRVGHTMLSPEILRLEATDQTASEGDLALRDAFFNPTAISTYGIDGILRGLAGQRAQTIDSFVVDDIRNFLFGPPGSGGFDLASLNIQRGRDHGLPDYNALRVMVGLDGVTSFDQISDDADVVAGLASVYSDVDSIDPWVGLLAEKHAQGSMVGETLTLILSDQFQRLRDGDRFWYESYLPQHMINMVESQTLSKIIKRNTDIGDELSDNVFIATDPCPGDYNNDGNLNFFDISLFMAGFSNGDARADYNANDGVFDFFDVSSFIAEFKAGCP